MNKNDTDNTNDTNSIATKLSMPRREFVRGAMSTAGMAVLADLGAFSLTGCKLWPSFYIPQAAYVRSFGAVPAGVCSAIGDQQCATGIASPGYQGAGAGLSVPGLGIPLGGVGAGSFMINQCGTFGPWNMGGQQSTSFWEMRTLPQAAFHIREESVDLHHGVVTHSDGINVKTLAVPQNNIAAQRRFGSVLPAWNQLQPGDGTYATLYPFGYMTYKNALKTDVTMKFWSPIVANEDERTSMPVAFFDMQLTNPTTKMIKLSVMLTFPNASPHTTGSTRGGLYSRYDFDAASGIGGVTLGSDATTNSPDSVKSEWTIAAALADGQTLSYCTSWNGAGDGSDIYAPFSAADTNGNLPNGGIDQSSSAGAIAVTLNLPPLGTTNVRFALSWDFPQIYFGSNATRRAVWMRRYTAFLGGQQTATNDYIPGSYPFKQGFTIARNQLSQYDQSLTDVEAWWRPIAENLLIPVWLRKAALNELYQMAFNGSFWESGLVSNTIALAAGGPRLGSAIPDTHIFYTMDAGGGGASANEVDVDSFGYLVYAKLFPGLELSRIRVLLQMIRQNPIGIGRVIQQTTQGTGPYISTTASFQNFPATTPPSQGVPPPNTNDLGPLFSTTGGDPFRDCMHKLIYRTYALYTETSDDSLLTYGYAPLLKALEYSQFFRPVGSHLPMDPPSNNPPNTYDQIAVDGHGIYNCQLYLLSLQILSTLTPLASQLGVPEATPAKQAEIDQELVLAKAEFEQIFWNPTTGRYRFCDGTGGITGRTGTIQNRNKWVLEPDAIFLDSFYAQGIAMQLGLPDLIDLQHAQIHLNNVLDQFLRFRDGNGNLMGAPTVLDSQFNYFGKDLDTTEVNEVIPGCAYMAAASAVRIGQKVGDSNLVAKGLQIGEGVAYQTYDVENNGFAFMTPESWYVDEVDVYRFPAYTRARSVWSLLDAVIPIQKSS